ncbi:hypothetical protein WDW37_06375 [Bdellovibrionota bacterium FG-1]
MPLKRLHFILPALGLLLPELASATDRLLWDAWYTVTVNKTMHYEYYNEHAEIKKDRVVFQTHAWKKEEHYINEEQLGAFAANDPDLTPLFFNFHSNYRTTEISIDGNVKDGKQLTVHIRKGQAEPAVVKRMVPKKTFLASLFPIWLGNHLANFKPGQLYGFHSILEDNLESGFTAVNGQVRREPDDSFAQTTHTLRLQVIYQNLKSFWWVEPTGGPVRIEMPSQKTLVERVERQKAETFLTGE